MLSLQWEPEIIAISLMYLAGRMSKFDIVDWHNRKNVPNEHWWDQLVEDLSVELMEGDSEKRIFSKLPQLEEVGELCGT